MAVSNVVPLQPASKTWDDSLQDKDTVRPFRIWQPAKKKYHPGRFYSTERRAQDQALLLVRWEHVGTVFEVLDIRTMQWCGSYKRDLRAVFYNTRKQTNGN